MSMLSLTNRTAPSPKTKLAPPGCMLPIGMSLYGTSWLDVSPELIGLVTFRQETENAPPLVTDVATTSPPRSHVRKRLPNGSDDQDISPTISVLDVPSGMAAMLIGMTLRWNMPDRAVGTVSCVVEPTGYAAPVTGWLPRGPLRP